MNSYFAYTRVSTTRQGEQGSSLQEQRSAIEAYAKRHGLTITTWFEEMETAAKLGRKVFTEMLKSLERGAAAGLIIHKIDRSARHLKDWAQIGELLDRGIDVQFAHESLDMKTRGGRLAADIQAVVAADYIRNLKQEVRKGIHGRLSQGLYPFKAPLGYLDCGSGQLKQPDPFKASLVRKLFELYASGHFSIDMVREEMSRRGLKNCRGRALSRSAVAVLLRNPFYIGLIRLKGSGETHAGKHQPIVPQHVFDRVQAILDGRGFASPMKHAFAYRRLLRCAVCQRAMSGERQKGHVYYRCHRPTCRKVVVRETKLDAELERVFGSLEFGEDELRDLRDIGEEDFATEMDNSRQRQAQTERALGLCEDRLTRLTDAFLDATIDKEAFELRKAGLLRERAALREARALPQEESPAAALLKKFELGQSALVRFQKADGDEKRQIVQDVSSNLTVNGKEPVVTLLFPFCEIAKSRGLLLCGLYCTSLRTSGEKFDPEFELLTKWFQSLKGRRKSGSGAHIPGVARREERTS